MKNSSLKRILALMLTIIMLVSVFPTAAFATESEGGEEILPEIPAVESEWCAAPEGGTASEEDADPEETPAPVTEKTAIRVSRAEKPEGEIYPNEEAQGSVGFKGVFTSDYAIVSVHMMRIISKSRFGGACKSF